MDPFSAQSESLNQTILLPNRTQIHLLDVLKIAPVNVNKGFRAEVARSSLRILLRARKTPLFDSIETLSDRLCSMLTAPNQVFQFGPSLLWLDSVPNLERVAG